MKHIELQRVAPADIEARSMELIGQELGERVFPAEQLPVVKRVIHTTADFEYADSLVFSAGAVEAGVAAIRQGCTIVTDTQMAFSGVNKRVLEKFGGRAVCFMSDPDVAAEAKARGETRATVSMERAARLEGPLVLAIGNAPTALVRACELIDAGELKPALVIGVPVGFVNVVESKELLLTLDVPYIVARGRKGGSNVAAAICNAMLYQASNNAREEREGRTMTERAVLAVSFGTSHRDTLEKNIAAIEAELAAAFPERTVRRAFTSGMILRKLAGEGTHIDNVPQALERLLAEGCTDVVVQPTHVMNGEEYHKLLAQAEPYRARFARMSFGRPLLTAAEDYAALGRALMEALPAQRADTAVLYMGHGSEHQANSAYALMEYAFHDLGRKDVVIGTVEGYPGFGEALRRLKERPQVRRVELRPLMTVAGDHAKNDLAGDEEDSWRRRLEAEGYETVCVLTGLGEHPAVRALFVEHARQAEQLQAEAC